MIDTRQKRASSIAVLEPWRASLPVADGAIGQADRQQAAFVYSGILAAEAAPVPVLALPPRELHTALALSPRGLPTALSLQPKELRSSLFLPPKEFGG